jgi:[protein-PII] uridylyltransferase
MSFVSVRDHLLTQPSIQGHERRELLTAALDAWLTQLFEESLFKNDCSAKDFALISVGSYGRLDATVRSDVDLVLLHQPRVKHSEEVAASIWYPIWDAGVGLDHSVRTVEEARSIASEDVKVLTGLLDLRLIAGNSELSDSLREKIYSDWRKRSRKLLPDLRELVVQRQQRAGDLFQILEPDLKECYGGLRDVIILRAISATWLVETAHSEWESSAEFLASVRDRLHLRVKGDRLRLQDQPEIAEELGYASAQDLLRDVYLAGRQIAYASDRAWEQLNPLKKKKDIRRPLAEGVVSSDGHITVAKGTNTQTDFGLRLAVSAAASRHEMPISPTILRIFRDQPLMIDQKWNRSMRDSLIEILGSRYGMQFVFESLDQFDLITEWIPEWNLVRSLPQFNALHEFTVDRHLVETVLNAQEFTRNVKRPDLLLIACLLHDIGKGVEGDHSIVGATLVRTIMERMGFPQSDIRSVELLVLHHLLLADLATRRDLDDPAVLDELCSKIETQENMDLLLALTISDSRATGPSLRTQWRENLISDAAMRASTRFRGAQPDQVASSSALADIVSDPDGLAFHTRREADGFEIIVGYPERIGLLACVAGVFAMHRLHVRAADLHDLGDRVFQVWSVRPLFGDLPEDSILKRDIKRALVDDLDLMARLEGNRSPDSTAAVTVTEVSEQQTVLEVRARDRKALLFDIARSISECGLTVKGARISTLGLDAVDVFFLRNPDGDAPSVQQIEDLTGAIGALLTT